MENRAMIEPREDPRGDESLVEYYKKTSNLLDKYVTLSKGTTDHGPDISISSKDILHVRELLQELSNSPILVTTMFYHLGADLNRVDPPVNIRTTEMRTKDIWLLGYLLSNHLDDATLKLAVSEDPNPDLKGLAGASLEPVDYGNDIQYYKLFLSDISKKLGEHYTSQ